MTAQQPLVRVSGVHQDFPSPEGGVNHVLSDISFSADMAETICILGPSGCGKSTILRVVSGMYDRHNPMPTQGEVYLDGSLVTAPHPAVLTVFQRPVLKGWLTVWKNVMLPFKSRVWGRGVSSQEREDRVAEMLKAVGLASSASLYPRQLSGGMQQRVSLAARLVVRPKILCLDEPFSALDPQTRLEMQDLCLALWGHYPCLALFVTHDVTEALRIADRIIVLSTRPATIVSDLTIAEPKPRSAEWLKSPDYLELEHQIISRIRDAATASHGTLNVEV